MTWPADIPTMTDALIDNDLGPAEWEAFVRLVYAIPKTLGVNPHAPAADVAARLAAQDATIAAFGSSGLVNLHVTNDATSPNSTLRITADVLAIDGTVVTNVSVACDITVAGKNGLDTGSEATSTWYSVYVGLRPDTAEVCGLFSTSATAPTTTHASLDGLFTQFRRVARVFNDGSGHLRRIAKDGDWCRYELGQNFAFASNAAATDGADNTPTTCADWFPPGVRLARVLGAVVPQTPGAVVLSVRRKGTPADTYTPLVSVQDADVSGAVTQYGRVEVGLDANREFEWMADVTPNANLTAGIYLGPAAFYDPS